MSREKLEEIKTFFAGVKYDYGGGPLVERTAQLFEVGSNCQLLAHVVLEELGYGLPKDLRSKELYEDQSFTYHINPVEVGWRPGDILFTYRTPEGFDPKQLHLSVCATVEAGEPQFLHAVKFRDRSKDAVTVWSLSDFEQSVKHNHIIAVKRVGRPKKTAPAGV